MDANASSCAVHRELEMHGRKHRKGYDECDGDGEPDGVEGHLVPVHPVPDTRERHRPVPGEGIRHPAGTWGKLNIDWNTAYACVMCIAYMVT